MKTILTLLVSLLIVLTISAEPVPPLRALQVPINQIIDTLKDPQYQDESQTDAQQKKIRDIIDGIFDFDAIARLAVGRHWKSFSLEEKAVFSDVFSELLGNSYIERMRGEFKNEKVVYTGERRKSSSKTVVKTKIVRAAMAIPVDYSMRLRDDIWKIYDVRIEGVSLVKNYRTQFSKILFKGSPATLIEQIKKKIRDLSNRKEKGGE